MTADAYAARVASLAQLACLLEASAPKPGNVSPGRPFTDLRYEDFVASTLAIVRAFDGAARESVGRTVLTAIESTREWTSTNTNLGIVLLLAPLAKTAAGAMAEPMSRNMICDVLEQTTVDDARDVYAAIRLAQPGGLGRVDTQDVAEEPTMTLLEVMRLAAHYDSVASEYASAFEITFITGAPALQRARRDGLMWDDAIVETFLTILARKPDSHIVRRVGIEAGDEVSEKARVVLSEGGVRSLKGRRAIDDMDKSLRDERHSLNPGTTADLTTAAIFVVLLEDGFRARRT